MKQYTKSSKLQTQFKSNRLNQFLFDLSNFQHRKLLENVSVPWEVLPKISSYLKQIFELQYKDSLDQIIIGKGTVVEQGAKIKGPCIIGSNCEIRHGAYIRGNVIIGNDCVIGNSSQLKNSLLLDGCQIPHFNYVGDSIIGNKVHLAAGVIISNLKLDSNNIVLKIGESKVQTNLKKIGAFIGDNSQIGCNTVINPGSIIGKNTTVYPGAIIRQNIDANMIYKVIQNSEVVVKRQFE